MNIKPKAKTEKIVYFVRHGQSEDNAAPLFQGPQSPLSEKGKMQANFIAKRVCSLSFEALISSPLQRAKQTAEAIALSTHKQIDFSDLFVERVKPSEINGKPHPDKRASELWRDWEKSMSTPGLRVSDAENYDDIIIRADRALAYLYDRPEKILVVVTHGYFLRALVARVLLGDSLSAKSFKHFHTSVSGMENTGVSVLLYEGAFEQEPCWRLHAYNDHTHLAE